MYDIIYAYNNIILDENAIYLRAEQMLQLTINFISVACVRVFNVYKKLV